MSISYRRIGLFEAILRENFVDVLVHVNEKKSGGMSEDVVNGATALQFAVERGNPRIVELLLQADMFDENETEVIGMATLLKDQQIEKLLIDKGMCVAPNTFPYVVVKTHIHEGSNERLAERHARPQQSDKARSDMWDCLERNIVLGADINGKVHLPSRVSSTTVLHEAVKHCGRDVVKRLLSMGASVSIRDGQGKTPTEVAIDAEKHGVANLLKVHEYTKATPENPFKDSVLADQLHSLLTQAIEDPSSMTKADQFIKFADGMLDTSVRELKHMVKDCLGIWLSTTQSLTSLNDMDVRKLNVGFAKYDLYKSYMAYLHLRGYEDMYNEVKKRLH